MATSPPPPISTSPPLPPPFQVYPPFLAKHFVSPKVTQFSEGPTPPPPRRTSTCWTLKTFLERNYQTVQEKRVITSNEASKIILKRPFAGPKLPETVMQSLFKTPLVYCPGQYPNREFCKKVLTVTIFPTRCLISKTQESCSEFRCTRSAMN